MNDLYTKSNVVVLGNKIDVLPLKMPLALCDLFTVDDVETQISGASFRSISMKCLRLETIVSLWIRHAECWLRLHMPAAGANQSLINYWAAVRVAADRCRNFLARHNLTFVDFSSTRSKQLHGFVAKHKKWPHTWAFSAELADDQVAFINKFAAKLHNRNIGLGRCCTVYRKTLLAMPIACPLTVQEMTEGCEGSAVTSVSHSFCRPDPRWAFYPSERFVEWMRSIATFHVNTRVRAEMASCITQCNLCISSSVPSAVLVYRQQLKQQERKRQREEEEFRQKLVGPVKWNFDSDVLNDCGATGTPMWSPLSSPRTEFNGGGECGGGGSGGGADLDLDLTIDEAAEEILSGLERDVNDMDMRAFGDSGDDQSAAWLFGIGTDDENAGK